LATILTVVQPRPAEAWSEFERLELPDGDFLDLAWRWQGGAKKSRKLAVLCHGLEGSLHAPYIRSMADSLAADGWNVLAWNYRNCGAEANRLARSYHSGASEDLRAVVDHAAETRGVERMALIGFSLGGNLVLKYAGEQAPNPAVRAVVGLSAPVDLASCAGALDRRLGNRVYLRRFLKTLIAKTQAKALRFPDRIDADSLRGIRTIREFDDRVTAPLHGFAGAVDYWTRCSALPFIPEIPVPALLVNALNDPLLDRPCFPRELAGRLPGFHFEGTPWGGHLGFQGIRPSGTRQPWLERRVLAFLKEVPGLA
jgi:hypothetical protein